MLYLALLAVLALPPKHTRDPHTIRMVTVEPGVKLEVIDFGGKGPALIFLAGLGNTAHVFDEFAPRFANKYHVYGITRRGFGASTLAKSGYDTPRLVADIIAVLDTLHIRKAAFAGHSISGDELTLLGGKYPGRVRGLIYLDAAYDHSTIAALIQKYPGPSNYFTEQNTRNVPLDSLSRMIAYATGTRLPLNELYQIINVDGNGRAQGDRPNQAGLVIEHVKPVDYRAVNVPSLSVVGVLESPQDMMPSRYKDLSPADKIRQDSFFAAFRGYQRENMQRYKTEMVGGREVRLLATGHYVFLLEPRRVESEMRAFLAGLKN